MDDLGALSGLNFLFFFIASLRPSEGSRRPNRAAVTPIDQQNPPGRLKLLVLYEKTGKNTIYFLILLKTTDFLDAHYATSCGINFKAPRAAPLFFLYIYSYTIDSTRVPFLFGYIRWVL